MTSSDQSSIIASTKHQPLRLADLENWRMNPVLAVLLDAYRGERDNGVRPLRILDWGCGRGRVVLKLRQLGYESYGVDIDGSVLDNAAPAFNELGLDVASILKQVSDAGDVDFDEGFFDIVLSDQVLEHVADPATMLAAMARVLRREGVMFHCFPAHRGPVECHLGMPFVHWLPKNDLRRMLIALWLRAGIDPGWQELSGVPLSSRVQTYHEYSTRNTFYRAPRQWRALFEAVGFSLEFVSHLAPGAARLRHTLAPLRGDRLVNWLMTNGRMVYLSARRNDEMLHKSASDHSKE